jgi:hypothetical protein
MVVELRLPVVERRPPVVEPRPPVVERRLPLRIPRISLPISERCCSTTPMRVRRRFFTISEQCWCTMQAAPLRWRRCGLDRFRRGDFVSPRHTLGPAWNRVPRRIEVK